MLKQLIYFQGSETNKEGVFFVFLFCHCPKNFSICGFEISIVQDIQNLPDLPPKFKMLRLLNEKGNNYCEKCPEELIS
jgi:hypothetical protein